MGDVLRANGTLCCTIDTPKASKYDQVTTLKYIIEADNAQHTVMGSLKNNSILSYSKL